MEAPPTAAWISFDGTPTGCGGGFLNPIRARRTIDAHDLQVEIIRR
jgi:hypothetical protein